jgi:hypothetical protein
VLSNTNSQSGVGQNERSGELSTALTKIRRSYFAKSASVV